MSRNYGIGSLDMAVAGQMVVDRLFHGSYQSKRDIGQRWRLFCQYAAEHGIKKMEAITRECVIAYGKALQAQLDAGQHKSSSAPKNYVSAINTVMRLATHQTAQRVVDERIACLMDLQRAFGLRFKESCLLNPKRALKEALKTGSITLTAGTKGGRRRTVPCRPCGIPALERAKVIQGKDRSMIPKNMTYREFQVACYAQAKMAAIAFHPERHHYAQERYTEITGAPAPVHVGWSRKTRLANLAVFLNLSEAQAQQVDHEARLIISKELGHNRKEITNAYLG